MMGKHRSFGPAGRSGGIKQPGQVVSFDLFVDEGSGLVFDQILIAEHSFQGLGNADVVLYPGHLPPEGVEGIPKIFSQDDRFRFRIGDDETAFFGVEAEIDGDRSDSGLETGEEALDEWGAVVEENGYVGPSPNSQSAKGIGQAIDPLVGLLVGPFRIAVSDGQPFGKAAGHLCE
jgi:hypothetical protein